MLLFKADSFPAIILGGKKPSRDLEAAALGSAGTGFGKGFIKSCKILGKGLGSQVVTPSGQYIILGSPAVDFYAALKLVPVAP